MELGIKKLLDDFLSDYEFKGKNVFEFGPLIKEEHLGILKHASARGAYCYTIDECLHFDQSPDEARMLAEKYNFTLDITDYNETIDYRVSEVTCDVSELFKENFYDLIFARCSWHTKYSATTRNLMTLCNIIGKDGCKVILLPWFNDPNLSSQHYIDTFKEIDYEAMGFKCRSGGSNRYRKDMRSPTIVITKNID